MKQQYNRELLQINTEEKAYFLGLLYSDGCITDKGNYQKHVRLSLADKELIDKLYGLFPFFNYEKWDFSKYNSNCLTQYSLRKTSKELYKDLSDNGLLERKSTENRNNVKLPLLEPSLIRHFIRGYFDGDGSVYKVKNRPNALRAEICSVSKNFIEDLKDIFLINKVAFWKLREKLPTGRGKLIVYSLEWTKAVDTISLKEFMYKDSTIFLERKKKIFDSFKLKNKLSHNPICPMCLKSECSVKRAKRVRKNSVVRRYFCNNCNKGYTIQADVKLGELLEKPEEVNQQPS